MKLSKLQERSARRTKGFLLRDLNGDVYFRVYDKDHSFIDYNINHQDLEIMILDHDAMFKNKDTDDPFIDYSNQTLGIK